MARAHPKFYSNETVRLSEADGKAEGPRVVGREQTGSLSCSQRNKRMTESGRAVCQGLFLWLPSEQPKKGAEQSLLASDVSPCSRGHAVRVTLSECFHSCNFSNVYFQSHFSIIRSRENPKH